MRPEQAWAYAAQWGSFIRIGDPGACMYGFSEDCRPQSEQHRKACIAYINRECLPVVAEQPKWYDRNEVRKLKRLRQYLATAPLSARHAA